jgi:predicted transcriptional regulator
MTSKQPWVWRNEPDSTAKSGSHAMTTLIVLVMPSDAFQAFVSRSADNKAGLMGDKPVIWFNSIVSVAKVLSDDNREILAFLANSKPASIQEFADQIGKPKSTLARALATLERYGFVKFDRGQGRARIPRVTYDEIHVHIPLISGQIPL